MKKTKKTKTVKIAPINSVTKGIVKLTTKKTYIFNTYGLMDRKGRPVRSGVRSKFLTIGNRDWIEHMKQGKEIVCPVTITYQID